MRSNLAHLVLRGIWRLPTRPIRARPFLPSPLPLLWLTIAIAGPARASEDASTLFAEAATLGETGACDAAIDLYDQIIERFPGSPEAPLAHYNAGLCHERAGDLDAALQRYAAVLDGYADRNAARDARFRHGLTLLAQGFPRDALRDFRRLERGSKAAPERERAVLDAQIGSCLAALGRPQAATDRLVPALEFLQALDPLEDPDAAWYMAQIHVALGDILADAAAKLSLSTPDQDRQRERLERRIELVHEAGDHYRAAGTSNAPLWTCAAGFKLGRMLELLREDVLEAPAPRYLDEAQRDLYRATLEELTARYLLEALAIYRETVAFASMAGVENRWVDAARERLETLDLEPLLETEGL
jgi:tetratricopeptide (TPR) repeat protein